MWRVYHLVILFYFAGLPARAQYDIPENNVWIFDKNAGLDFNSQKLGREIQWPNTITRGVCV